MRTMAIPLSSLLSCCRGIVPNKKVVGDIFRPVLFCHAPPARSHRRNAGFGVEKPTSGGGRRRSLTLLETGGYNRGGRSAARTGGLPCRCGGVCSGRDGASIITGGYG